jgi:uncharacterized repeat protein (TIGR01451 family)
MLMDRYLPFIFIKNTDPMRNLYAIFMLALCSLASNAQIVNIPDYFFKSKLLTYTPSIDTNSDSEIQVSEALAVTDLDLSLSNIYDFTGLEAFSNLHTLDCSKNYGTDISLSGFPNLESFVCKEIYSLTALSLSGMPSLQSLNCSESYNLVSLTLTGIPDLKILSCRFTKITSLDVSGFSNLNTLICGYTELTALDATGLANLKYLNIAESAHLTSLNVAGLSNLITLDCSDANLTELNLSGLTGLKELYCVNNRITALDVSDLTSLNEFYCGENKLSTLDLSMLTNLKALNCNANDNLLTLNIAGLPNLETVSCAKNSLTTLDLSGLTHLITLECYNNHLTALSPAGLTNLESLYASKNNLTALDVSGLINLKTLECQENQLTSLNLAQLPNLDLVRCHENQLTTLDASNLANLTYLHCSHNQLTSLNLANLPTLYYLFCQQNRLTTIDVSNLLQLSALTCGKNLLTAIDVSNLTNLYSLGIDSNQLTTLDLSNLVNLNGLDCSKNQLSVLDVSHQQQLTSVNASYNLFTALNFSYTTSPITRICDVSNNPNLTYLNVKNGTAFALDHGGYFSAANCPNLHYICADERNFSYINVPDAQVNSYCSFTPGGVYNTISGTLTYDFNNNGCDAGDAASFNSKMKITEGLVSGVGFANASGNYSFQTQAGNFSVSPDFENSYFTVSPPSADISFTGVGTTQIQNFCITPNGIHNDVEITIISTERPRPGFDSSYTLVYKNKGNQILSGNIDFTFDDAVLDFVSANPALASQALNTLSWSYDSLLPFESRTIHFTLNVNSPQETPPVNGGQHLSFGSTISPVSGDETIGDNSFVLVQIVRNAFDPNDKTCLEGNTIAPEKIGDYLHYIIRFQNSGTAPAENIVVKDMIDTGKFDMASFQLTGSSHPHLTKITGNKVEFQFPNINLPTESEDEPGSHGYVAFKIKTKSNLALGNAVENKADIYFDYNFPIETNTATTTVSLLANRTFENKSVSVFPNPVKDKLHITAKDNITSVQLYDIQGRLIETVLANDTTLIFDLDKNTAGVYFVKIATDSGMKVEKIIKE